MPRITDNELATVEFDGPVTLAEAHDAIKEMAAKVGWDARLRTLNYVMFDVKTPGSHVRKLAARRSDNTRGE